MNWGFLLFAVIIGIPGVIFSSSKDDGRYTPEFGKILLICAIFFFFLTFLHN